MQNNEPGVISGPTVEPSENLRAEKARGDFDLRGKRNRPKPVKIYAAIGLLLVLFILAFIGIWTYVIGEMRQGTSQVDESKAKADATLNAPAPDDRGMKERRAEKLREFEETNRKNAAEEEEARRKKESSPPPPQTGTHPSKPNQGTTGNPQQPQPETPAQRKLSGGVVMGAVINNPAGYAMGVGGRQDGSSASGTPPQPGSPGSPPGFPGGPVDASALGVGGGSSSRGSLSDLSGVSFAPTQASLAPDGKYLLAHGTYARCAVYPEVITEQPGIVDCRLTEPLYSADGSTVIAEASARLTGVQKVALIAGQQNVFTSWTELETQWGVRARLDSLGAGPMGASGTKAWIDNHYGERYGGAIMLSFIQDALKAATTATQSSGSNGYTVNNSEQNVESMADKALNSTVNIAPTGYILPGTVLTVIVARDIDFSNVYENR
ncbi:TrbI/VirB10 family protein [Pseudomonas sp. PSPC3-3]|uniref:TrbI/VirB10 family protein n=1 Tax=unclassified Pseudomonas TaxID=196821 RepID=UPI003CF4ECAC